MSQQVRHICIRVTLFALLLALLGAGPSHPLKAQGETRAGLVVQFGDGSVRTYCLPLTGESVNGLDLLLQSGLQVQVEGYGGMGALVCKIEADGCDYPGEACVCKSYGPGGVYWNYFHLQGGAWKKSGAGASGYKVRSGDVEGWAWSSGNPPPIYSFSQICGAAQPVATNTQQPTTAISIAPSSTATATSQPPVPTRTPASPSATNTIPPTEIPSLTPPTQSPATATPTARPQPTTTRATASPTAKLEPLPPTSIPTPVPQIPATGTPTIAPSSTPVATYTPGSTATPAPSATKTEVAPSVTPTPNPRPPTPNQEIARNIALGIAGVAIAGLAAWRIAVGRRRGQSGEVEHVE